jgi:hypothetical protein
MSPEQSSEEQAATFSGAELAAELAPTQNPERAGDKPPVFESGQAVRVMRTDKTVEDDWAVIGADPAEGRTEIPGKVWLGKNDGTLVRPTNIEDLANWQPKFIDGQFAKVVDSKGVIQEGYQVSHQNPNGTVVLMRKMQRATPPEEPQKRGLFGRRKK